MIALQTLPITFQASRSKTIVLLLTCAAFVAAGFWLWPRQPIVGELSVAFFGLGMIVFAVNLHPRSSFLTLSREGFIFASIFRAHFVPWRNVQSFAIARIGVNKMVCWNYTPEFREHAKWRQVNVAMSGAEAGLPDTYGMKPEALCALLNDLRRRHGRSVS
jgi:hypothetical protein